jgi:hypothetical protein
VRESETCSFSHLLTHLKVLVVRLRSMRISYIFRSTSPNDKGQLMRLSYLHPIHLYPRAERKASAMICNAVYDILIN